MSENAAQDGEPAARRANCLLAEDDEVSQEIVAHFVASLGFVDLEIASDGREALGLCMARKFDLLIFDRKMPFIHGDKLIRHLRASSNVNSATPTMLFSASSGAEIVELGASCPADMILSKPINRNEFLAAIRDLLQPSR
ncbi:MAG: response regulator [Phaeovulum sp.]|uniref:response regulator n=1 Tax=Phaeovulum sp. TaxID=2934796 RepID=UPI002736C6E0|nr:response regulator [Phaeovulum sp.]MDP3862400.1 response regulator [Phaeovulum sp.]